MTTITGGERRTGAQTRAEILRVALRLFTDKGFEATSRNLAINGAAPARSRDRQNLREAIDNPRLRTRPRLVRPFAVGSAWNGSLSAARNR